MAEILATYDYRLVDDGSGYSIVCTNGDVCTKAIIPGEYDGKPITSIGDDAFLDCSLLTRVEIGNSVTSIGDSAFLHCDSLTSVVIGDSVTSIGYMAFYYCYNLTKVMLMAKTPPSLSAASINERGDNLKIYCYKESLEAYKTATNWNTYADKFIADDLRLHFTNSAIAQKKYFANKEELNNSDIESLNTQRAKVQNAPIEDDDVVRLQDIVYTSAEDIKSIIWG